MKIRDIIQHRPTTEELRDLFQRPLTPGLAMARLENLIPDHRLTEYLESLEDHESGDIRPQLAQWIQTNRPDLTSAITDRRTPTPSPMSPISGGFITGSD